MEGKVEGLAEHLRALLGERRVGILDPEVERLALRLALEVDVEQPDPGVL